VSLNLQYVQYAFGPLILQVTLQFFIYAFLSMQIAYHYHFSKIQYSTKAVTSLVLSCALNLNVKRVLI